MSKSDYQAIGERLKRLEKQNRYMKRVGVLLILAVAAVLFMGAAKKPEIAKEIKARRIVLADLTGKERVVMETNAGITSFRMLNPNGNSLIEMMAANEIATLLFADRKGNTRFSIMNDDTGSNMRMFGSNGKERVFILCDDANSVLSLCDSRGVGMIISEVHGGSSDVSADWSKFSMRTPYRSHASMRMLAQKGNMKLELDDSKRRRVSIFASDEEDGGVVRLYNKTNDSIVQLHADEYGNGVVGAYNRKGLGRELKPRP